MTPAAPLGVRSPRRILRGGWRRLVRLVTPAADPFAGVRDIAGPTLVKVPAISAGETRDAAPSLVVLLPNLELPRMTGGPNTALNLGARVAARGTIVRFVATHGRVDDDTDRLRAHVAGLAGLASLEDSVTFESVAASPSSLRVGRHEVPLATWWPTAHVANAAVRATGAGEFLYLIQDFEPGFYPWSTNHALALATYDFPFRAVFNEALLREHFVRNGIGRFADGAADSRSIAFEPAVDRDLFRPQVRTGPRRLLFYARPKNPRNAFELGLRALRVAVERSAFDGDWEFRSIGDQVPELPLGGGRMLRPVPWQALPDYAALLGGSDVLVSLMLSPHTSYPPLEMAAGGGTTITNSFGVKTAAALSEISSRIVAVKPEVDAIAGAIADAARGPRPDASPTHLALPTSWDATLEPVVDWILRSMASIAAD